MNFEYVPTICPYCGVGCGFYLKVRDGELAGVALSKSHPVSQGRLCVKGITCWESVVSADRIRNPLVKQNGKLVETSWDRALDMVARRFSELKNKYGPDGLGVWSSARCTNESNYLIQKFARVVLGT